MSQLSADHLIVDIIPENLTPHEQELFSVDNLQLASDKQVPFSTDIFQLESTTSIVAEKLAPDKQEPFFIDNCQQGLITTILPEKLALHELSTDNSQLAPDQQEPFPIINSQQELIVSLVPEKLVTDKQQPFSTKISDQDLISGIKQEFLPTYISHEELITDTILEKLTREKQEPFSSENFQHELIASNVQVKRISDKKEPFSNIFQKELITGSIPENENSSKKKELLTTDFSEQNKQEPLSNVSQEELITGSIPKNENSFNKKELLSTDFSEQDKQEPFSNVSQEELITGSIPENENSSNKKELLSADISQQELIPDVVLENLITEKQEPFFAGISQKEVIQNIIPEKLTPDKQEPISTSFSRPELKITPDNIFLLMHVARISGVEHVLQKCLRLIESETKAFLLSKEFMMADLDSVLDVLTLPTLAFDSEAKVLHLVILWLQENGSATPSSADRKVLLRHVDILSLSPKEFAETVEMFPDFFSDSEVASVLMNLVKPSSRRLPEGWGTTVKSHTLFYTDESLVAVFRDFQSYALKLRTTTGMFKHCTDHKTRENSCVELVFKIKLSKKFPEEESHLVVLELAFGEESLSASDFEIKLFVGEYKDFSLVAVDEVEHWLVSLEGQYALMLKNPWKLDKGRPFELKVKFRLKKKNPALLFKSLDESKKGKSVLIRNSEHVGVRLLTTELVFFKTILNTNDFLISAFYFDSCKDYKKYLVREIL